MKITVINGTPIKGVTYLFKENFLKNFGENCEVEQFYPQDLPEFCLGCKNCIMKGAEFCPHNEKVSRICESLWKADLIVFAYPVYALRAPASIKSLLDHLCFSWMVHRPEERMFGKMAVILTNSVGIAMQQKAAQKDVRTSLSWMGVSKIFSMGAGMMGDIFVDKLKKKNLKMLENKAAKAYRKVAFRKRPCKMGALVAFKFKICKAMHKAILKTEEVPGADNQHFLDKGWIKYPKKKNKAK